MLQILLPGISLIRGGLLAKALRVAALVYPPLLELQMVLWSLVTHRVGHRPKSVVSAGWLGK